MQSKHQKYNAGLKGKSRREEYRQSLYQFVSDMKRILGCSECPEIDPVCLAFHHCDPKKKLFTIAHAVSKGFGKQKILAEIVKCIVLCFNCHAKLHAKEPVSSSIIREAKSR